MKQLALLNRRVREMWKLEAELPPQERELHSWQFTATQGGVTYLVGKGSANTFFTRVDEGEIEYMLPDDCFAKIAAWMQSKYVAYAITKSKRLERAFLRGNSVEDLKQHTDPELEGYYIVGFTPLGTAKRLYKLTAGLRKMQWVKFKK